MSQWDGKVDVLLVGGGMISQEVILPTVFQERRRGRVGKVTISSLTASIIKKNQELFPDEEFEPYPDPAKYPLDEPQPELFKEPLKALSPQGVVIVATPDHLHTPIIMEALDADHHVVCEKPLCLKVSEAHQIAKKADQKARYVYTDYHKRHDRAVRAIRRRYRQGYLGELLHGHAWIEEKREMSLVNFAAWAEKSSSFEYIGVHYVDVYYFITGLEPKKVAAFGQKKFLPTQGKDAYDAVQAVIEWEDGSVFWVQTHWVGSDHNSSLTNQGLQITGTEGEYWADHKDRNLHFVTQKLGFEHYNPNFFKDYDSWQLAEEREYVGYGYESIKQGLDDVGMIEQATLGLSEEEAHKKRKEIIHKLEETRPLPRQALIGVAVNEAVRLSIDNNNAFVGFDEKMNPVLL